MHSTAQHSADRPPMRRQLYEEFRGLTNERAYVKALSERLLRRSPGRQGLFLGTDQREYFLPLLQELVAGLPEEAHVFDFGAGAGEIVDSCLAQVPGRATIHLEEPNPRLFLQYVQRVQACERLRLGTVYNGLVQDYYHPLWGEAPQRAAQPQDLVLGIHMLYHLTDFHLPCIHPEQDLLDMVSFMYGLLREGGAVFLAYADLEQGLVGEVETAWYARARPARPEVGNLRKTYAARNRLLKEGHALLELARRFPRTRPTLESHLVEGHLFSQTLPDMAALCLVGELLEVDDEPFDMSVLEFAVDYLETDPRRRGLVREHQGPRQGMWRADQPQVVTIIRKGWRADC